MTAEHACEKPSLLIDRCVCHFLLFPPVLFSEHANIYQYLKGAFLK